MDIIIYEYMAICNGVQLPFFGNPIAFDFSTNKMTIGFDIKKGWCKITNKKNQPIRISAFDDNFINKVKCKFIIFI